MRNIIGSHDSEQSMSGQMLDTSLSRSRQAKRARLGSTTSVKSGKQVTIRIPSYSSFLFTVVATFAGVLVGVLAALSIVKSDVTAQVSAATSKLNNQFTTAADVADSSTISNSSTQCPVPAGSTTSTAPAAAVTTAASAPTIGKGGGNSTNPAPAPTFVHKLVSGTFTNDTGTITNTGPDSSNSVTFDNTNKTTVTNNNNFNLTNTTSQSSDSGSAKVVNNTTGGEAITGDATNNSSTAVEYRVSN
jgi:hypothetical protein